MTSQEEADVLLAGYHAARDGLPLDPGASPIFVEGYRARPTSRQSVDKITSGDAWNGFVRDCRKAMPPVPPPPMSASYVFDIARALRGF